MKLVRDKRTEIIPIVKNKKKIEKEKDYGALEKPNFVSRINKKQKNTEKEVEVQEIQKHKSQIRAKKTSAKLEKKPEIKEAPKKKKKKETDEEQPDVEDGNEISVDDAIELIGVGKFQFIALFATGMCFCADSMEIALLSFLSIELSSEWNLSNTETASITGVVFAGEILGAILLGYLGDMIGRRPTFLIAATLITLSGFGSALAYDFPSLILLRFLVGVGVGGLTVPFDIYAEFLPPQNRGFYLMLVNYFWTFGSLLVPIFAYLTFGMGRSWRLFVFLCSIPCLISSIVCYFCIPESPRWLASKNRNDEALIILRNAASCNGINPMNIFPAHIKISREEAEDSNYLELLRPKWRKISLLLWGLWFSFGFAYNGLVLLITKVFEDSDELPNNGMESVEKPSFDFEAIAWSSFAETIGVFVAIQSIDSWGRINSQMAYFGSAGIATVLMLMPQLAPYKRMLILLSFIGRSFEISANCITWITTAEVLPTELRASGHSAANVFCRIGAVLTSYVVEGGTSFHQLGLIMGIIHLLAVLCVSKLPETKGAKMG